MRSSIGGPGCSHLVATQEQLAHKHAADAAGGSRHKHGGAGRIRGLILWHIHQRAAERTACGHMVSRCTHATQHVLRTCMQHKLFIQQPCLCSCGLSVAAAVTMCRRSRQGSSGGQASREGVSHLAAACGVANTLQLCPHIIKHLSRLAAHCSSRVVQERRVLGTRPPTPPATGRRLPPVCHHTANRIPPRGLTNG